MGEFQPVVYWADDEGVVLPPSPFDWREASCIAVTLASRIATEIGNCLSGLGNLIGADINHRLQRRYFIQQVHEDLESLPEITTQE